MSPTVALRALLAALVAGSAACQPPAAGEELPLGTGRSALNSAPVLAPVGNRTGAEGQPLSFTLSATDADGDPLSWTAAQLPTGSSFPPDTHTFSWTPKFDEAGTYDVTFSVSDGTAQTSETVRLTISNTNRPPEVTPLADRTVAEGSLLGFTVLATDPDADALTFAASALPPGATFNPATRAFAWTPGYDQAGSWTVSFSASDGAATSTDEVSILVGNTNRPPTLPTPGTKAASEGSPLALSLSGSDPDGDPLTYAVVPLPPGAVLDAAAGTFTWTPGYTQSGTWSMTVTLTDGAATATAPLVVTVANTNRPPVLSGSGPAQVDEGTEWSLSLSATDPDGTSVVLSCAGLPAGAALETLASRVRWTPGYTQAGAFTFTCSASDGSLSAQASFSVTVRHVNLPPSWPNTPPPPLHEGTEGALALGASDPDGDTLSYSATGLPPGAAYDPASGLLTWTPGFDQAGSWPLTLTASDGQTSSSRSLLVVVADTNLPPSLSSLPAQTVSEGHLLEVTVTGTDGDGDALTWSASGLPVGATFDTATLRFRWRPEFGRVGTYTVTFTARDEQLAASATLSVTVTPGNRPPELFVPGPKVLDESELVTFTVSGVDPEGEPVSFGARDLPPGSTFDPGSRTFSWIPTYEQSGRWTVTFTASDGSESAEASVVLTVGDVNRGPTLTPVRPQDVFVGAPVSVTFNAVDPEGDPVTFSSETLPAGASLDASSGRLDWVPTEAQVGQAVVRVRASDSGGLGSEISVTFRVQGTLVTGCAAAPGAGGLWALALSLSILAGRARRR